MPKTSVNGVELLYGIEGEGHPAIFIHGGFGGPQSTINPGPKPVLDAVPLDRFQIVTYDRRCAGQSQYDLSWYNLEDLAADARELMRGFGFDRFVVIGSSMGGMVALQVALMFPDPVTALALMNTGPNLMAETPWGKANRETVNRVRESGDEKEFERVKDRLRNPPAPPAAMINAANRAQMAENRAAYLKKVAQVSDEDLKTWHAGTVRNFAAFSGYDFESRLSEVTIPTLIVHGDADTVVPFEYAKTLKQRIPHAEFHAIPDANHGILAYPKARDALRTWLNALQID